MPMLYMPCIPVSDSSLGANVANIKINAMQWIPFIGNHHLSSWEITCDDYVFDAIGSTHHNSVLISIYGQMGPKQNQLFKLAVRKILLNFNFKSDAK